MIQIDETPEGLLNKLDAYNAPTTSKVEWVLQMTKNAKAVEQDQPNWTGG